MPFKEVLLVAVGVALCLGNTLPDLPEAPEVPAELVEGRVSSRYGEYNRYYLHNRDHYRNPAELTLDNVKVPESSTEVKPNPIHKYTEDKTQTVVIVHGHGGNKDSQLNKDLIHALLTRSVNTNDEFKVDIIVVDWEYYAGLAYSYSPLIVPSVASHIANLIKELVDLDVVELGELHLVGFDLGAHVVGFVGRLLPGVARITALDPALEAWGAGTRRVSASDAKYVEVIHTDAFGSRPLGIADALGHVDIYPNGGTNQPGCSNNECNHNRAWALFVATVMIHDRTFDASGCASITEVTTNRCVGLPVNVGGVEPDKFADGLYRGVTTAAYPYF